MREALVSLDEGEFAELGIEELVSLARTAGIRDFEELACHGDGGLVQVEVDARLDETELAALDYVNQWEYVTETDDGHLYVIAFTTPALPDDISEHADDLVGGCDPELFDGGAVMSLVGPQGAIADVLEDFAAGGADPDLRKLGQYEGRDHPLDELTDRQREVVKTAYEMGYYDVPRGVSTDEVAAELDVDDSTVAEHLQRAERNLLAHHLSAEG